MFSHGAARVKPVLKLHLGSSPFTCVIRHIYDFCRETMYLIKSVPQRRLKSVSTSAQSDQRSPLTSLLDNTFYVLARFSLIQSVQDVLIHIFFLDFKTCIVHARVRLRIGRVICTCIDQSFFFAMLPFKRAGAQHFV